MKSYLITGGAGFIGSHLQDALLARGDYVVILDDLSSGKGENIAGMKPRSGFIEGDIRRLAELEGQIGEIDAVIHLAALISGHDSLSSPDDYIDVNVNGLLRVVEFVARRKIPRIIFASSSTVYGNNPAERLTEAVLPAPETVYAVSKLAGEHLLRLYAAVHGFSHCSLRLFNVYGPRQSTDHPYANVTCKFSHAAANGLPVKRYGDGEQSRDFVYVSDVVDAFLSVLDGSDQAVYNVGTGVQTKINELIALLGDLSGGPLEVEQLPPWPNDIRKIRADTSRLEAEFRFKPATSVREGLATTVEFFRGGRGEGRAG